MCVLELKLLIEWLLITVDGCWRCLIVFSLIVSVFVLCVLNVVLLIMVLLYTIPTLYRPIGGGIIIYPEVSFTCVQPTTAKTSAARSHCPT